MKDKTTCIFVVTYPFIVILTVSFTYLRMTYIWSFKVWQEEISTSTFTVFLFPLFLLDEDVRLCAFANVFRSDYALTMAQLK